MQNQTTAHGSLGNFASSLSDLLQQRFGIAVRPEDVAGMLADSAVHAMGGAAPMHQPAGEPVQAHKAAPAEDTPPPAPETRSLEAMVRASRSHGSSFCVDFIGGGQTRVTLLRGEDETALGQFSGDFLEQFRTLTGLDMPVGVWFSAVAGLSDGSQAIVTVQSSLLPLKGTSAQLRRIVLTAVPAKSAPIPLRTLGVTQLRHMEDALDCRRGLFLLAGKGRHTTLRAASEALEQTGCRVAWIRAAADSKAVVDIGADAYIFESPVREPKAAALVLQTAQSRLVLAVTTLPDLETALDFFLSVGFPTHKVDDVMLAVMRQDLLSNPDGFQTNSGSLVLVSEVVPFREAHDVQRAHGGALPYRLMQVDAAEKVRTGKLSEQAARDKFGKALDVYL